MKKFLPVIHVTNNTNVLWNNIDICIEAKVDGIFLISHGFKMAKELIIIRKEIKRRYPELWVGFNFLELDGWDTFSFLEGQGWNPEGIWIDNSHVGVNNTKALKLQDIWQGVLNRNYSSIDTYEMKYFGGVAFKYLQQPKDLKQATIDAIDKMDIVTTSGEKTGKSASISKVKIMHDALDGKKPLALASGISIENINDYLPYVDYYLVSSSISNSHDELNKEKTIELSNAIHDYKIAEIKLRKKR